MNYCPAQLQSYAERQARLIRMGVVPPPVLRTPDAKKAAEKLRVEQIEIDRQRSVQADIAARAAIARRMEAHWISQVDTIVRLVAHHYRVPDEGLRSSQRTADLVLPRQIAMYLAKTLTPKSLPAIGRRLGGRDHTTVLHGVRKIAALVKTNPDLAAVIDSLRVELAGGRALL